MTRCSENTARLQYAPLVMRLDEKDKRPEPACDKRREARRWEGVSLIRQENKATSPGQKSQQLEQAIRDSLVLFLAFVVTEIRLCQRCELKSLWPELDN